MKILYIEDSKAIIFQINWFQGKKREIIKWIVWHDWMGNHEATASYTYKIEGKKWENKIRKWIAHNTHWIQNMKWWLQIQMCDLQSEI